MKKYIVLLLKYIVVFFIIFINFFLTKKCIYNKNFKKKYEINTYKNYNYMSLLNISLLKRCIISGLLHSNWVDFFINMFLFYNYSTIFLKNINILTFLIIYFVSIFFVNIIMYLLKIRTNYVNSHGGISCIMYITSLIHPTLEVDFFPMPIIIPIWLLTIFSIFYFGFFLKNYLKFLHILGAILGIIFLLFFNYKFFIYNYYYSILILTPLIYILYYKFIKVFFI